MAYEELPDNTVSIIKYGKWDFNNLFYELGTTNFYYKPTFGNDYRKLSIVWSGSKYPYVCGFDKNWKKHCVYLSKYFKSLNKQMKGELFDKYPDLYQYVY